MNTMLMYLLELIQSSTSQPQKTRFTLESENRADTQVDFILTTLRSLL
jgi:hypothetical protein